MIWYGKILQQKIDFTCQIAINSGESVFSKK